MPRSRHVIFALLVSLASVHADGTQSPAPPLQHPLDPAGDLVLDSTGQPAEGSLPVAFVRSPDDVGPDGGGRYLVVVNSGYGVQFTAHGNHGQQLLQVIDLLARPAPAVVQSVYFPTPDSVNVGLVFGRQASADGSWPLYASGGFGNRIWVLTFTPGSAAPISPAHEPDSGPFSAPFIDLTRLGAAAARPGYNDGRAPIYPTGLAISANGRQLYVANNLGDSLGIVEIATGALRAVRLADPSKPRQFVYPYDVRAIARPGKPDKVFVSCWNDSSVAVVDPARGKVVAHIPVGAHPNAMLTTGDGRRLLVASANTDTVSVIDTAADREIERIAAGLGDGDRLGGSAQALALSDNERALFVADAQTASVAVVQLGADSLGPARDDWADKDRDTDTTDGRSRVAGYVPTARYPSALAVVDGVLYVGNGKGEPAARPNGPTIAFPPTHVLRGAYSVSLMRSSIRRVAVPDRSALSALTTRALAANGLTGPRVDRLFDGASPITHVVYIIKENRTYDQVFGDVPAAGDGTPADGDPSLAIFGSSAVATRASGARQDITPNQRALALRFGLFDRFFVNSEASPDGHNWSTAAFSTDYVDKSFRWNYSGRGRTYDFEGFNRLPDLEAQTAVEGLRRPATAADLAAFLTRFVPYKNGWRDAAEPDSLYLWDAAARAGLSYRTYGEFVATLSADDVAAVNVRKGKRYPDVSATALAIPSKLSLEGHFSPTFRAFDLWTPDAMTTASYQAARRTPGLDPTISARHADARFRGTSRLSVWLDEFDGFVADLAAGKPDRMPALSVMHLPNDHTAGMLRGHATPQFLVADNDYALGRLVQAISHSPYWKNTAVLVVEDDAQDGPDHVDAHRSPVLVVSAYNKPGQLVHDIHNTVSLIRTLELLLGIPPMNLLDASAVPMNVFRDEPDLTPFDAQLPVVADDNLMLGAPRTADARRWMHRTATLALGAPDMADPRELNEAIWFSATGSRRMPEPMRLAVVDAMQSTLDEAGEEEARQPIDLALLSLRPRAGGR